MTSSAPNDFICPLTKELMRDPVVSPLGTSYEREAIMEWLGKHESCPVEGFPLEASELRTNSKLQWKIRYWQANNETRVDTTDEERRPLDRFVCPLTNSLMVEPVTTREGHNYERQALERFVARHGPISPFTGQPLGEPGFYPNKKLAWDIKHWKAEPPMVPEPAEADTESESVALVETKKEETSEAAPKTHTITIPGGKVPEKYSMQRSTYIPSGILMDDDKKERDVLSILDQVCQLEIST